MDSVGGVLNAFTAKEYTCYYAKVLDENLPLAIDLLSDIFLHSVFDPEEIERERQVILQEISQTEDTAGRLRPRSLQPGLFRRSPARPADLRRRENRPTRSGRDDFLAFVRDRYLPRPRHRVRRREI
jgi:predicted Zn-dependent peptidase